MTGLTGARVIVVDDQEEEATPVLKALARKGIPAAYFNGNSQELPQKNDRLSGVRLAILDMDLIGGGASGKTKAAALANVLKKILTPGNGPYALLIWTRHPELQEIFENYLFLAKNIPNPIFSVMIAKDECKDAEGNFDLTVLSLKIQESLSQFSPLLFLQAWEEQSFAASTAVTSELSSLAVVDDDNLDQWRTLWKTRLLELMYAMARAEAEQHLDNGTCLNAIYNSLSSLHADRMESNATVLSHALTDSTAEIMAARKDCDSPSKARLNTMLHLSFENLNHFTAGNIYKCSSKTTPGWVPDKYKLLEDIVQGEKGSEVKVQKMQELSSVSIPVLVEVSAACDHAQKNIRLARFIYGLIVPANMINTLKRNAGFIWEFGPIFLKRPVATAGQYYIYFSSRHLVTSKLEKVMKFNAVARLRSQALTDLRFWYAQHAARAGIMLLR